MAIEYRRVQFRSDWLSHHSPVCQGRQEPGNERKGNKNIINLVFAGKLKKSVKEKINQLPDKISERSPPLLIVQFPANCFAALSGNFSLKPRYEPLLAAARTRTRRPGISCRLRGLLIKTDFD